MDEKIDKIIDLCGTKNKYQYILVFISFISWINNMMVSIALPFLEKTPEIIYIDPKTKEIKTSHLNYTICTWDKSLYNISKIYEYSWVNEFNISCDQVKTGLIGSLNFGGSFLGSITLNFFADNFGRKNTTFCYYDGTAHRITETVLPFASFAMRICAGIASFSSVT